MQQFSMPTKIYMGVGCLEQISRLSIKRAYIICDPFLIQSGMIDQVTAPLQKSGSDVMLFGEVVPDPTIAVVTSAVAGIQNYHPHAVIAVGGGSAIDTAKAASYIANQITSQQLSLIAIPTTSGTGSEVTNFAVISDPEGQAKYPLRADEMLPAIAFLDPQLTLSVPAHITADTGMDVLTHAIEAYVSTAAGDFTDAYAQKAVSLVVEHLPTAVADGKNLVARTQLHQASCLAGIAFNGAGLGLCHSMAHALGARFHISHGKSNAMLLPEIIRYNAGLEDGREGNACQRYVTLAKYFGLAAGTDKATVYGLVQRIRQLLGKIKIPLSIGDLKISQEEFVSAIPQMTAHALADQCSITNPRVPNAIEVEAIYRRLYQGRHS